MPRFLRQEFSFGGLNTRADATGLPLLDAVALQDMRVVGRDLVQRYGIVRLGQVAGNLNALDYDGAAGYCESAVDARVWTLGLKWTLEVCVQPDIASGTHGILCAGDTTPSVLLDQYDGNYRFRIWDSGATLTTVTVGACAADTTQTIQVTRDGATLTARLDNGAAVTGTMSATLNTRAPVGNMRVGRNDGTDHFDGAIDYVRLFGIVKSDHADRLVRHPSPRAGYVLADYTALGDTDAYYDRSRYENHLDAKGGPTNVVSVCHNAAPIRALGMMTDEDGKKQLLVLAGGKYYIAEVD